MKKIFISGKYSGKSWSEIEDNIRRARLAAVRLLAAGWAVYCPHTMTAHMEEFEGIVDGIEYETFLKMDLEWLKVSDAIFMLNGWEQSHGAKQENLLAEKRGIEIYFERVGIPIPEET